MTPRSRAASSLEIVIESPLWKSKRNAKTILQQAVEAASAACKAKGDLCIVLTDDAAIRKLNRTWRRQNKPTNVLSFPAANSPSRAGEGRGRSTGARRSARFLGDIVIAYETTAREAVAESKPFPHHLSHLVVHGFLHLLGYDHTVDDQAEAMERLERAILARLDVPDPYAERATGS
jgi:probable rRNA maturation factor